MPENPKPINNWFFSNLGAALTARKADWFRKYSGSVNDLKNVLGTDSFDIYEQSRIKGAAGFNKINTPDGSTLSESLRNPVAGSPAEYVKNALAVTLQSSDDFTRAQQAFNSEASHIYESIQANSAFHPGVIASTLLELRGQGTASIKAQQALEKTQLTNLFSEPAFIDNLKNSFNCSDSDVAAMKREMLDTLDKSHKEQLEKFEKALSDSATKLFDGLKKEFERISFLGYWYHRSDKMKEAILALAQANDPALDPAFIELNPDEGLAILKNINVRNLSLLKTLGGKDITKTGENTYTIRLNRLFQTNDSIYEELTGLALALKAAGYDGVVFDISNKDPKKAEELGRKAYESAIRAGFDPSKITININNEPKMKFDKDGKPEKDELFNQRPERLAKIKKTAEDIKENLDAHIKGSPDQVQRYRAKLRSMEPPVPAAPGAGAAPAAP